MKNLISLFALALCLICGFIFLHFSSLEKIYMRCAID